MLRFVRPRSPLLARYVTGLWYCAREPLHRYERVLPSGAMQLLVDLAAQRAIVTGPMTRPTIVATSGMRQLLGAVFLVGRAWPFVSTPCHALHNDHAALVDVWPHATSLVDRLLAAHTADRQLALLEQILLCRLTDRLSAERHDDVSPALAALADCERVASVAADLGLSCATLGRRFAQYVGVSPKAWAGVARFQRATKLIAAGHDDLADVAVASGYYDQAHMTRSFRAYGDLTPSRYRPLSRDEPNHVAV